MNVLSEQELVHFVAGTLSYKAYRSQRASQTSRSYPYCLGFAFGQINAVVEYAGGWPAAIEEDQQKGIAISSHIHKDHTQEGREA